MFQILWAIIVGFVVGVIARAVLLGDDPMGLIATTLVGIAGSLIGAWISRLFSKPAPGAKFHRAGFLMSIVGAVVLLIILRMIR